MCQSFFFYYSICGVTVSDVMSFREENFASSLIWTLTKVSDGFSHAEKYLSNHR